jgi:outer membrane protein OmpA-like peptidoglycan-associated protein
MRRLLVILAPVAALAVGGCAASGKLRENASVVRSEIEKAKRSGAMRCAPKELALAEANLQFTDEEVSYGDADRAKQHLDAAEKSVKDALRLSRSCGPTQVLVSKKAPEGKILIEKTDRDGDGVPDIDDACPELAGKPEFKGCPDADADGIPDSEDACPTQHGPRETQGCPVAKDTDADGTPDDIDRCPLDPEDKDGFQDEDGCPDPDNDGDGIVDKADACPNTPGPLENQGCPFQDTDGDGDGIPDRLDKCPDQFGPAPDGCPKKYTLVEVKKDKIAIKQQVHFATAKFRVLPSSFKLLNQVVQVLNDFPKMRVSIEGHTDNVGGEKVNMRLSKRRAEAVRDYLVSKGVSPSRLEAVGYGPTKPLMSNKTARGKAKNRRTEFRIIALE